MGQCLSAGQSGPAHYETYRLPEMSPAASPDRSASPRSFGEGPLSGLSRRNSLAAESSSAGGISRGVGFAPAKVLQETITERGEEVKTTELDLCIGVAVGGVQYAPDGSIGNTSVSMFHVLPNVPKPGVEIVRKVMELRNAGFEVSAYVAGSDGQTRPGQSTRSTLEAMLGGMDVPFKSAPHSGGDTSQYLSAKIDEDGRVQYGVEQSEFNWKNFESPSFEDVPTR